MAENEDIKDSWLLRWAQVKTFWAKIKALIGVETDRAKEVEAQLNKNLGTLTTAISAEVTRADGKEKELLGKITTEATTARAAEKKNADAITALTTTVGTKADKTALEAENTARTAEDTRLAGLISAHQTAADAKNKSQDDAIAKALQDAKDYANSVATGAMKWMGTCEYADLETKKTTAKKGEFWTITDKENTEYAWDGEAWMCVGADVDFTQIRTDIDANSTKIANEVKRATDNETEITGKVTTNATAISTETTRAKEREDAIEEKVTTNTTNITNLTTTVSTKANSSDVVKLTGDQTVAGVKTFSDNITAPNHYTKTEIDTMLGGVSGKLNYITYEMVNGLT